MNFLNFREKFFDLSVFTPDQVYTWHPGFDRNNFHRWIQKGLIIRLRNGYYTFREFKSLPHYRFYFANKIYKPSYISLHSALAYYGLIPESVVQITSVTTLKTENFVNDIGEFTYKKISRNLFFGYRTIETDKNKSCLIAAPEKGIIDLLYLYPEYETESELLQLRFDEDILEEVIDRANLLEMTERMNNKALSGRINKLIKAYGL